MFSVRELIDVGPLPHGRGKFGIFVSDVTLAVKDPKSIKRLWTAREGSGYITPSSYSTCPGLSIKWTGRRLVIDSGTKCAWVIHESKAVQIHLHHSNRRCLYVPRVLGSVKNPHNNNNNRSSKYRELKSFNNISLCITRNNNFIQQNWGLQGYTLFFLVLLQTQIVCTR